MVDAISIKIFAHLAKAPLPPIIIVFCHFLPIISGETPILAVSAEIIGRCAGIRVEIKEIGEAVSIHAVVTYAYGEVPFKINAFGVGIFYRRTELFVEMPLHPAVEIRLKLISFGAEVGISVKPIGVLCREVYKISRGHIFLGGFLFISFAQIIYFQLNDSRIIYKGLFVQLLLKFAIFSVHLYACSRQMHIKGMQRK